MPQFDSGAAEPIGRFSEGLLLRLLHSKHTSNPSRVLQTLTDQTLVDGDARSNCSASFCKASPMTA